MSFARTTVRQYQAGAFLQNIMLKEKGGGRIIVQARWVGQALC